MRKFLMILAFLFIAIGIASCTGAQNITVTFEENGGEAVEDMVISINSTSINLPTPVREGFTFDGWYLTTDFTQPFTIAALLTQTGSVTLYAKWTEDVTQYTITFESNGGSSVTAITQGAGTTVTAPADPTKSGFTFGGWFSDSAFTTSYTFGTMPAENITLYAKWVAEVTNQTITFESNGGSAVANLVAAIGSTIAAPTAPTKMGYTFAGWYSDSALTTAYTFSTMPANPLTLYAKWTLNNYTISFEENGGSVVADKTQGYNTAVTAPTAPTKTGYTFAGWYSDSALTTAYTFSTMPAQNITLYAKWTLNNYTITFEENGGSAVADITQGYLTAVVAPTAPTKMGYTFGGWYSDSALTTEYTFSTMSAQNITLYAKWTLNNYTITFEENGGSAVTDITQGYLTAVVAPTAPTKTGYTFAGWYSDIALTTAYTFSTMPAENMTLYAKWDAITYTITFMNVENLSPMTLAAGAAIVIADPTKEGYEFHSWYIDQYFITPFDALTMPEADLILYAKWLPAKYLVHYNTDGGTLIDDAWGIYTFEIPVPDMTPYKENFKFVGWYLDAALTIGYDNQMMPADEVTLYAKYIADTDTLTIADFIGLASEDFYYIQAVILYIDFETDMMIVADATGMIMSVAKDIELAVGDEVILYGVYGEMEGMTLIMNSPEEIVYQIVAHEQDVPLAPLVVTTGELYALDETMYPWLVYTQVLGTLRMYGTPDGPQYAVEDIDHNQVPIFMITDTDSTQLSSHVDEEVRVTGIWMNTNETEGMRVLIFLDRLGDVGPMFTDEELTQYLADKLESYYTDRILRPGSTQLLPTTYPPYSVTLAYEVLGVNASLYDLTTGVISDTITEHTEIGIRATITAGASTVVAEFTFVIEPIVTSTIAEFLVGNENDEFTVRGIVVLAQTGDGPMMIADDTGYMFIVKNFLVEVGDEIIVTGLVTLEQGIKLMWDYETTVLDEILSHNLPSPLVAEALTVEELNLIDMTDTSNWGRYIETVGISAYEEYSYYPMLYMETNYGESIPYMPSYLYNKNIVDQSEIYMYSGFRVLVRGFLFPTFDEEDPYAPDRMIMIPTADDIYLDYANDQEKMDALIAMGEEQLENRLFHPFDELQLPNEMPVIGASFVWEFLGDISLVYDEVNDVFLDVTEQVVIQLQATVTIGSITQVEVFNLTVAPYPMLMIEDFYGLQEGAFGKLQVIVAKELSYGEYILQEPMSLLYLHTQSFYDLVVGDQIIIFGQKVDDLGFISIDGWGDRAYVQVLSSGTPEDFIVSTGYLSEIATHSHESMNLLYYYEVEGFLHFDSYSNDFYLTDGVHTISLFLQDMDVYAAMELLANTPVRLRFFNYQYWWTNAGDMWTGLVINTPNFIEGITFTDEQIANFMMQYATVMLNQTYKDGLTYTLPTESPYFGGTIGYQIGLGYDTVAAITGNEITFTENANEYGVVIDITVTYGSVTIQQSYEMTVYPYDPYVPTFVPGSLGELPVVMGEPPVGEFAGLYIYSQDRNTNWGGGDDMVVDLYLPEPWQVGADYYTLQYYDMMTSNWVYFDDGYGPIESYYDNFSLVINSSMTVRAITNTGLVSNTVDIVYTDIDTYFTGYGIDMGMWITGVMTPFVGYGLILDEVGIFNLYTHEQIFDCYTVQWYRVNPYTFEKILIDGETEHTYITQPEDIGYYLMVQVKADEVNAGGMMQILIDETVKLSNEGFINNATNTGFDIGFEYALSLQQVIDMMRIYDTRGNELIPVEITPTATPFVYHVEIDFGGTYAFNVYAANEVMIAGMSGEYHMMEGFYIDIFEW